MPLITNSIPNLIAGVSQQPDGVRFPTQVNEQVNMYPSIIDGLIKRMPTNHLVKAINGDAGDLYFHTIRRGDTEKYCVVIRDGSIKVFDAITSTEKTVAIPDGVDYLDCATPSSSLRCLTVADYTFICNREIEAAMDATTTAATPNMALVFVRQGLAGIDTDNSGDIDTIYDYTVAVNGTSYTYSHNSFEADIDAIAAGLASALSTGLGAGWTVTRYNYVIKIVKDDGSAFTAEALEKSGSEGSLRCFTTKADTIQDLPVIGFNGTKMIISGVEEENGDDYYVEFKTTNGESAGSGKWLETVAGGITYQLDAATMPHILVRESDGTFTFKQAEWEDRVVGDNESNDIPSFVGKTINNIVFHKNRLGLLAGENACFSEASGYFNFWRTTIIQLLDGDPVTTPATGVDVSTLFSAAENNSALIAFGQNGQFLIAGGDLFTPKTANVSTAGRYLNSQAVDVLPMGDRLYFVIQNGSSTGVSEFALTESINSKYSAFDITAHVPTYIRGTPIKMCGNDNGGVLLMKTDEDANVYYVYKFYFEGVKRLQSAWCRFELDSSAEVMGMGFINDLLMLAIQYPDGLYLESQSFAPSLKDDYSSYFTPLDRRITDETTGVSASYDSVTDTTTFSLPFVVASPSNLLVVTRFTNSATGGRILSVDSATTSSVTVDGDYTGTPVWIGLNFDSYVTLPKPVLRKTTATGGGQAVVPGIYFIRNASLLLGPTMSLTAEVYHPAKNKTYTTTIAQNTGYHGQLMLGSSTAPSGTPRFWIQGKNNEVVITLRNSQPLPSSILSIDYEGMYNNRSPLSARL